MEPISFFLDTFIKLVDRIINLKKSQFQDRQQVFNEIVKPLFEELEPVALNYMDFFQKARLAIEKNPKNNLLVVAQDIRKERDAMVMARIKVRAMANQIKEYINDEDIVTFAASVNSFFYRAPRFPHAHTRYQSTAIRFLEYLKFAAEHNVEKQDVIHYIDEIMKNIEQSWSSVVRSYEELKIHSTSSPKFIQKQKGKKVKAK